MFHLRGHDMKGNNHDGEKHVSVSKVQKYFKSDLLSAMGSFPRLERREWPQSWAHPA